MIEPATMGDAVDDPSRPTFDPGSFRDPLSRVVHQGGEVLRVLRGAGLADLDTLEATGFFAEAMRNGEIVATERVPVPPTLAAEGWEAALRHEPIPVLTYPYEWTFTMLQDAALAQLRLTRAALAEGMRTLRSDGAGKVLEGITTIEEVLRVTQEENGHAAV